MNAPLSLAFDGSNLYVADTYNQRILVYTMAEQDLLYNAVVNTASVIIYAIDPITIGGTVKAGNTIELTIGVTTSTTTESYTYTIQNGDTFASIIAVALMGTVWACKYAIPAMREAGAGSIVNISALVGTLTLPLPVTTVIA